MTRPPIAPELEAADTRKSFSCQKEFISERLVPLLA